jgi:hypothetical protein
MRVGDKHAKRSGRHKLEIGFYLKEVNVPEAVSRDDRAPVG